MLRAVYVLPIIGLASVCCSVRINEADDDALNDMYGEEEEQKQVQVSDVSACDAFVTHTVADGKVGDSFQKGFEGGQWSPCTHLKVYGLNFAPFLARFLAYQLAPRSALEFGCGLGTTSDAVGRYSGADVTCIEPEATLGQLINSLRKDAPGKGSLKQLALNVFSPEPEVSACTTSDALKKDLVFSFEVAEHIPAEYRPALIKLLAKSTGKWLVFSAARPGQAGTGHLDASMLPMTEWQRLFEKEGLVHMPKLSDLARHTARPLRSYDLGGNLMVFRSPDHNATDTDEPHEMLQNFREFWGSPLEWQRKQGLDESPRKFAKGHNAAFWPELTNMAQKAKVGTLCEESSPAGSNKASSFFEKEPAVQREAFTSAWAAHFYRK